MRKKVKIKKEVREEEVNINNGKNIKKFLIFLSLIVTIFAIYQLVNIFALFESEKTGTLDKDAIAKWTIIVNNEDIVDRDGLVKTFDVDFNIVNAGAAARKIFTWNGRVF